MDSVAVECVVFLRLIQASGICLTFHRPGISHENLPSQEFHKISSLVVERQTIKHVFWDCKIEKNCWHTVQ